MIVILLGSQKYSFHRLLEEVQRCIDNGTIKQEVIVQAGGTQFFSKEMKIFTLIEQNELEKLIEKADIIITHGGVGSIVNGVKLHKKVIAVPRYKKYGEVANDHQVQIINTFAKEGFIIGLNDVSELESALKEIENFKPKVLESNTEKIINIIRDFINNDSNTKNKKH